MMIVTLVKKKESIRLIAGMEYFYPDPKTFANVKFSVKFSALSEADVGKRHVGC